MDQKALALNTLQNKDELARLATIFRTEGVSSFLEIGSNHGGSLWVLGQALPVGGRVVSVDTQIKSTLVEVASELRLTPGLEVHLLCGDSMSPGMVSKVERLGHSEGMYDAIFIDADHSLFAVTKDWENYGRLARKIVAFHDIAWRRAPTYTHKGIEVPKLWASLKEKYRHEEIKLCPTGKNNGIGVLWMA